MRRVQGNAKLYYDRTARARRFEVGDHVIIIRPSPKNKPQVQWEGPADIVSKLSDTNYIVTVSGKGSTGIPQQFTEALSAEGGRRKHVP